MTETTITRLTKMDVDSILVSCSFQVFGKNFTFFTQNKGDGINLQVGATLPDNNPPY